MDRPRGPRSRAFAAAQTGAVVVAVGIVSLALGAALGDLSASAAPDPTPSASARAAPTRSAVTPAPTVPPTAVVTVPSSVDAGGVTDVTGDLQAVLDGAPDGALILFGTRATYRVEGSLVLAGRRGITVDGRGATMVATELTDDSNRVHWRIRESRDITLADLTIEGANPDPGVFRQGFEWQHAVSIEGSRRTTLDRVRMVRPMGDCVYVEGTADGWSAGVWVRDSVCRGAARQGIAVVGGRDIRVEGSTFGGIGLSVLDLEPEGGVQPEQGAASVVFVRNLVDGEYGGRFFNATGVGPISEVLVEDNVVNGSQWGISSLVAPLAGSARYRDIVFRGNRGEGTYLGRTHAFLLFSDVDNLVVEGNRQRIGAAAVAIRLVRACEVVVTANDFGPIDRVESVGVCR